MATYFARNVTGNWASNTSWDSTSSGGAGPAGPPIAGDTATFDSGFTGNISVAAAAACAIITCQAGATGTLTFNSGQSLTATGNVTFVSGFNLAGTGTLRLTGAATLTSGGLSIPNLNSGISGTLTLGDTLTITGTLTYSASTTMAGAFNITCANLLHSSSGSTVQLVSGQTLTVTSGISISPTAFSTSTIRSTTPSSSAILKFTGADITTLKCAGMVLTDIDFSQSTPVTNLDNWYGGTLTRCTNITNRTSADIGGGSHGTIIGG